MTIKVSAIDASFSRPICAFSILFCPSTVKGKVTIPIVKAPFFFAISATTGETPVPVPPPSPQVMKTMSESFNFFLNSCSDSLAACNPKIGEQAARESEQELRKKLKDSDMVFITCGLGGGTGTGVSPVVAEIAKKNGALTIGIVTLPFTVEGQKRIENAQIGLEKLASIADTLIVIPNDKLLEIAPELPIHTAFKVADEILTNSVKGITELITKTGLVNLDFADVKAVMENGGVSLIGIGESDSQNRARDAVENAINNPLLDVDISGAKGALINIIGGNDMSLDEYKKVMEIIGSKISPDAKIISGAQISPDMENSIKVLLIVTGVKSSQILGSTEIGMSAQKELEHELGVDFVEE